MIALVLFLLLPNFTTMHPVDDVPSAQTTSGLLRGLRASTQLGAVDQFLGVPYARPPIGGLRFRPPQKLSLKAAGKHVTTRSYSPSCMQPPHLEAAMYPEINRNESTRPNSEDCLYLNVYAPVGGKGLPILFWVPGEGYNYASSRQFDGSVLAGFGKTIVVTINYRVSAFGFLSVGTADAPGNVGIWDQIAALRWVRENAEAFGGDSRKVTLAGRFTGAMSITTLMTSPMVVQDKESLFQRAVIQSGVADGGNWIFDRRPVGGARKLARKIGCKDVETAEEIVRCLQKVDAETLNEVAAYLHSWRLVLDDKILPVEPLKAIRAGKHLAIPVVIGYTNDEGSLCVMTEKLMNSPYFSKMVNDNLDREAFTILARGFFGQYLAADEDIEGVVQEAVKQYEKSSGTWRDRYVKMCGDVYIKHKIKSFARQLSIHGSRVFLYEFVHRPEESFHPDFIRSAHGDDVLFTFGLVRQSHKSTTAEIRLSDQMMSAWTNFAKTGNPNPMLDSDEEWPSFSIFDKKYWEFSTLSSDKVKSMSEDEVDSFFSLVTMTETEKQRSNLIQH